ncbi:MAG: hypothetical protein A2452_07450 [Candidatus Firestonebacteria bacterium RIFOXYC2_FULL_39_67]|nr:MAG: hypothetical protein A2536_01655 [Candidatus Firestonebacteria bacterium RIFOXYD2_FULL_39_29]OGF51888.1 MAG: hypothetical protein A2497_00830 [Candidatus Firestonebacteria bacterium RifOxyC12_full_39_7]OGF55493.1 MAG: hypothetical protein A2452_07450 [Candidatus Firestonebacteria bacterium RIFOXYC2_FULL_39_67]
MLDLKGNKGKILGILYSSPDRDYYMQELGRLIGKKPGVFQKALEALSKEGVLKSEYRANARYFRANEEYPLYAELKSIVKKTSGMIPEIKSVIITMQGIKFAFLYGSYAKGKENSASDIDIFLVGVVDDSKLLKVIENLENKIKREINYRIIPQKELLSLLREKDPFILSIFSDKIIMLKGDEYEFRGIFNTKSRKKSSS